jgi:hypothetical protein
MEEENDIKTRKTEEREEQSRKEGRSEYKDRKGS